MTITPDEYDSPWKEVVSDYFPEFMAFFFPGLHRRIDWTAGYESLEQELREVVRDAEAGKRILDKLVKVRALDGLPLFVFIHLEVQTQRDEGFARRMFVYHYRLFDWQPEAVVSLAVLADDSPTWRPDVYEHELWGCKIAFGFPVVKLREYNDPERWAELEKSSSPFATVVMAHLKTQATRGQDQDRLTWKTRLTQRLYESGMPREDLLKLYRFIDWVLALPEELEKQFRLEVTELEKELSMPYVTSIERISREEGLEEGLLKGRKEGLQEGKAAVLEKLLMRRFGHLTGDTLTRLEKATLADLERWIDRVLDADSLEDVFAPS